MFSSLTVAQLPSTCCSHGGQSTGSSGLCFANKCSCVYLGNPPNMPNALTVHGFILLWCLGVMMFSFYCLRPWTQCSLLDTLAAYVPSLSYSSSQPTNSDAKPPGQGLIFYLGYHVHSWHYWNNLEMHLLSIVGRSSKNKKQKEEMMDIPCFIDTSSLRLVLRHLVQGRLLNMA